LYWTERARWITSRRGRRRRRSVSLPFVSCCSLSRSAQNDSQQGKKALRGGALPLGKHSHTVAKTKRARAATADPSKELRARVLSKGGEVRERCSRVGEVVERKRDHEGELHESERRRNDSLCMGGEGG